LTLIKQFQNNALRFVNKELINLYWEIGIYQQQSRESEWGRSLVEEVASHIQKTELGVKGFSDKNLWRMRQFCEAYKIFQNSHQKFLGQII
jgi:hypothetical protein